MLLFKSVQEHKTKKIKVTSENQAIQTSTRNLESSLDGRNPHQCVIQANLEDCYS